jgi:hypothetical protein
MFATRLKVENCSLKASLETIALSAATFLAISLISLSPEARTAAITEGLASSDLLIRSMMKSLNSLLSKSS